jgi:glycosyltransferase involved in cell wall biosynthesis
VLLNSDTLVFPGWLERLRAAAHSAADIGTATPFSNDATIFTYPDPASPSPMPPPHEAARLARQAARANPGVTIDVPTGHGFCLFIKAACLHETGLLRGDVFAQGYGEENDFCERAGALGWRHVAVPGAYVGHAGGVSFGAARHVLLRRNARALQRLHPGYHARVEAFIEADPLHAARRRLDALRWRSAQRAAQPGAVLLIGHDGTGGTGRVLRERAAAIRKSGLTPIVLSALDGVTMVDADAFPNLRFHLPTELSALARLLASAKPATAEIHHLLGHDATLTALLKRFALPYDIWIHDWQWLCPRLSFVTPEGSYCGEPPARECDACTSRGTPPAIGTNATELRARSAILLHGARRVVTASADASARLRRHFPGLRPKTTPWERDTAKPAQPPHADREGWLTVAVVGALGIEKGYEVLLACGRDAAARGLKLRFVVAGYTIDDGPLLDTGRVFVTGPFSAQEARGLIAGLGASFGFLPSIWPETWCYALSDAWNAGLDTAVFDIGAPAERVRRTGRGWRLPLNLPPASVNDALLRLQGLTVRSASLRP